jgi:predicted Fe-S protein YdhL (DUF1289 family)
MFSDPQLGVMVRHGLKVYSCVRDKWLLFCCRSAEEKQRWLQAMAEERRLVIKDRQDGLEFPPTARQLARMAARCKRRPPSKPRSKYPLWKPKCMFSHITYEMLN